MSIVEEMKNVDVRTVNPDTLVDITTIKIDENLPREERVAEFIRQVKNGAKAVSNSIANQKELVMDYLKSHAEIEVVSIYTDDGFSGVNFANNDSVLIISVFVVNGFLNLQGTDNQLIIV